MKLGNYAAPALLIVSIILIVGAASLGIIDLESADALGIEQGLTVEGEVKDGETFKYNFGTLEEPLMKTRRDEWDDEFRDEVFTFAFLADRKVFGNRRHAEEIDTEGEIQEVPTQNELLSKYELVNPTWISDPEFEINRERHPTNGWDYHHYYFHGTATADADKPYLHVVVQTLREEGEPYYETLYAVKQLDIQQDDRDNDGVPDDSDRCPNTPGASSLDGCPPSDDDGDGYNELQDDCPGKFGIGENGCPLIWSPIDRVISIILGVIP